MDSEHQIYPKIAKIPLAKRKKLFFLSCVIIDLFDEYVIVHFQTCVCANRIYVQEGLYDQYIEKLVLVMKDELKLGDPSNHQTTFGPMINEKALLKVGG